MPADRPSSRPRGKRAPRGRASGGRAATAARPAPRKKARRRPARRRSRWTARRALTAGLGALLLGLSLAVGWLTLVYPRTPGPSRGRTATVDIGDETTVDEVVDALADASVVREPWAFRLYLRLRGAAGRLVPGRAHATDAMTPAQIARRLARGLGPVYVDVTIPEGFDRLAIAERLEARGICPADAFLAATTEPTLLSRVGVAAESAEGYLFPDTYELGTDTPARAVVERMVRAFQRRSLGLLEAHAGGFARLRAGLGFGLHEVVTLASIVEKEAARDEERPVIAGVFLNRLRSPEFRPRRLQADPTVAYGCRDPELALASCDGFDGTITKAMLGDAGNPYNTYRHEGLPPGPIANPGAAALEAVLDADAHDFLYFVAAGGGRHHFSRTLSEHEAAIRRYLRPGGRR